MWINSSKTSFSLKDNTALKPLMCPAWVEGSIYSEWKSQVKKHKVRQTNIYLTLNRGYGNVKKVKLISPLGSLYSI